MKLLLKRKFKSDTYTVGDLFIDGKFFCHTMEDRVRLLAKTVPIRPKAFPAGAKKRFMHKPLSLPGNTK
jgi:hypothetical protein